MTIRVVVIDDSRIFAHALTEMLKVHGDIELLQAHGDIEVVGTGCDGAEALALVESLEPDS